MDEAVCTLLRADALKKGMNPTNLPQVISK